MLAVGIRDPNVMVYVPAIHLIPERDYSYFAEAKCLVRCNYQSLGRIGRKVRDLGGGSLLLEK